MSAPKEEVIEVAGREVTISNPDKVFFPKTGHTKLDLVRHYMAVAEGALRGVGGRPMALKRFVNGAEGQAFFQKRAPTSRPEWIETVELSFPSGRTAEEIVVRDAAQLAWIINLGCIDLNPHPVRAGDLDHPDELRGDLDPVPECASGSAQCGSPERSTGAADRRDERLAGQDQEPSRRGVGLGGDRDLDRVEAARHVDAVVAIADRGVERDQVVALGPH